MIHNVKPHSTVHKGGKDDKYSKGQRKSLRAFDNKGCDNKIKTTSEQGVQDKA